MMRSLSFAAVVFAACLGFAGLAAAQQTMPDCSKFTTADGRAKCKFTEANNACKAKHAAGSREIYDCRLAACAILVNGQQFCRDETRSAAEFKAFLTCEPGDSLDHKSKVWCFPPKTQANGYVYKMGRKEKGPCHKTDRDRYTPRARETGVCVTPKGDTYAPDMRNVPKPPA